MQVKKFEQSLAIVSFSVGGAEQLAHELEHFRTSVMFSRQLLDARNECAAVAFAALELLQLACQSNRFSILPSIQEKPDQARDFLHAGRIELEHLPDQRLGLTQPVGGEQCLCKCLAEILRCSCCLGMRLEHKNPSSNLTRSEERRVGKECRARRES